MPYSISQAQDDLAGIIHGKTVNKVTNIDSVARRSAQNLLAMIDPDETRRIATITIYDKILDVAAPSDLKEKRIIDIRPQFDTNNSRFGSDNLGNRLSKDFDLRRGWGSWFTVMNDGGTQYLRVKAELTPQATTLDTLDTLGSWVTGGDASNILLESIIFSQGAIQFDIAAGVNPTTGYVQNVAITSEDLTDLANKSSGFFVLYIPSTAALAAITSVDLRWGNDVTANYYNRTVTTPHFGSLRVGKNIMRFDWNGATKTGTINLTKIDSARISVTTNGTAISALIVSNLMFSVGRIWDIEYYSKYLFNNDGTWQDTVTDGDTTLNLDTASYNLFLYEFALNVLQQIQGGDYAADRIYFQRLLYGEGDVVGLYAKYKMNNPSQTEKPTQTYYNNLNWRGRRGDVHRGML